MKNLVTTLSLLLYASISLAQWDGSSVNTTTPSYVGIKTQSPQEALQVGDRWTFHDGGNKLIGYNTYWSGGHKRFFDDEVSIIRFDSNGNIRFQSAPSGGTSSTFSVADNLVINNNGSVGIGTTSPESKLQVDGITTSGGDNATKGTLQFAGYYFQNNVLNTYGSQYSSGATSIGYAVKQKTGSQGFVSSAGNSGFTKGMFIIDNEVEFLNAPASTVAIDSDVILTSRFKIAADGNVGIGITNPDSKLVVDGTIRSEEVKVEIINGPDTKEYIKENKHLPEIPSAAEMEENGVELGEMNILLLKKIEELTLYVIDLKEEIQELKAKK